MRPEMPAVDFGLSPFVVIWETTGACDLVCRHCRACAVPHRDPNELSTAEGKALIDEVVSFASPPPLLVLTGGDPMKRHDIYELVAYAASRGLSVALSPSATPLVTQEAVLRLRDAGLARMALSLDGPDAGFHDAFRGVAGSFAHTLRIMDWSTAAGLPLQLHTTITKSLLPQLDAMGNLVRTLPGLVMWSLFLLVPTGRGQLADMPNAVEAEAAFEWLYNFSQAVPFDVRTTAAQHYRRYLLEHKKLDRQVAFTTRTDGISRAPKGVNDGNGFVFVSRLGDICPSGFLPIAANNIRRASLIDVYRDSPLFQQLRDTDSVRGKCGICPFRKVCGGSRARAYAVTGDYMESDPCCIYEPPVVRRAREAAAV